MTVNARLPQQPPSEQAYADLVAWRALVDAGTTRSTKTAETWRTGLAAFVSLLTTALVLKGADLVDIGTPEKYWAVGLLIGGVALAVGGLWQALAAEAPAQATANYQGTIEQFGSLARYNQSVLAASTDKLVWARRLVFLALVLMLAGTAVWWLAAKEPAPAHVTVTVTYKDGQATKSVCGELSPAAAGTIRVKSNGATTAVDVPTSSIQTVTGTDTCAATP